MKASKWFSIWLYYLLIWHYHLKHWESQKVSNLHGLHILCFLNLSVGHCLAWTHLGLSKHLLADYLDSQVEQNGGNEIKIVFCDRSQQGLVHSGGCGWEKSRVKRRGGELRDGHFKNSDNTKWNFVALSLTSFFLFFPHTVVTHSVPQIACRKSNR